MYLIAIAWLYVAVLMAAAEATASNGTLLGAVITFVLYGCLPLALVLYLLAAPARQRAIRARQAVADLPAQPVASLQPDADGLATADPVTAVRKEP